MLSCAVILAACSVGCGSSSPANNSGKAGHGGNAGGSAGAAGSTAGATAGAGGAAGDNGMAGATAGASGATAGAGGMAGGTAGAAGGTAGAAGGTAGATAGNDGGAAGATAGNTGNDGGNGDAKTDVANITCVAGGDCTGAPADFTCSITRTCRRNQEQACFCAPNNKIACEPCDTVDAGTDAGSGTDGGGADAGGADAGASDPACPAGVVSGTTACDTAVDGRCTHGACNTTTHRQPECICVAFGAGGGNARWFCNNAITQICQ
jgi:hypothetical protein